MTPERELREALDTVEEQKILIKRLQLELKCVDPNGEMAVLSDKELEDMKDIDWD